MEIVGTIIVPTMKIEAIFVIRVMMKSCSATAITAELFHLYYHPHTKLINPVPKANPIQREQETTETIQ